MAQFLRTRRARISPADVDLPLGPGLRRTPGLRREEVATLAGVSVDYYTRIEQGRETTPSDAVLNALAQALRLTDDEHTHLLALADEAAGRIPRRRSTIARPIRPGLRLLVETVRPWPAYVLDEINQVLASNPEGLALMTGLSDWPPEHRNVIRYTFQHPYARKIFADWERVARNSVAQLRTAELSATEQSAVLVTELSRDSSEFAELWDSHDVRTKRGGHTAFQHPLIGSLTLDNEVLAVTGTNQRIMMYHAAPGTPEYEALTLLAHDARDPTTKSKTDTT